jgi:hypothetical protein
MWKETGGRMSACMISGLENEAGRRSKLCVDKKC